MFFRAMTGIMKPEGRAFYGGFVWGDQVRVVSLDAARVGSYPLRRASGDRAVWRASDLTPVDPSFMNAIYEISAVFKAVGCGFTNRKGGATCSVILTLAPVCLETRRLLSITQTACRWCLQRIDGDDHLSDFT